MPTTLNPSGYNVSLTYASAVSISPTGPALPAPSTSATAVSQWGSVSVGFAFSYQETATTLNPAAVTATSACDGVAPWGQNICPVYASATCQQSGTVTSSQQLTFFWG
jgi:hypothetical protein